GGGHAEGGGNGARLCGPRKRRRRRGTLAIDARRDRCSTRAPNRTGGVVMTTESVPFGIPSAHPRGVPVLTPEQMDLAEVAFLKLVQARHPGRPVTVRRPGWRACT